MIIHSSLASCIFVWLRGSVFLSRRRGWWALSLILWLIVSMLPLPVAAMDADWIPPGGPRVENSGEETPIRPVRLRIPSIGVDAAIEAVGEDVLGRMDTPTDAADVAWYEPGVRPGDAGNAVIAGHLDDIHGDPAAFWRIGQLTAGDAIIVVNSDDSEVHFVVVEAVAYPYTDAPIQRIFGFDVRQNLNFITCTGSWDRGAHTYRQRLVVYARRVPE